LKDVLFVILLHVTFWFSIYCLWCRKILVL